MQILLCNLQLSYQIYFKFTTPVQSRVALPINAQLNDLQVDLNKVALIAYKLGEDLVRLDKDLVRPLFSAGKYRIGLTSGCHTRLLIVIHWYYIIWESFDGMITCCRHYFSLNVGHAYDKVFRDIKEYSSTESMPSSPSRSKLLPF